MSVRVAMHLLSLVGCRLVQMCLGWRIGGGSRFCCAYLLWPLTAGFADAETMGYDSQLAMVGK